MKAIIYAGIGLFSVASVYGLVDYYSSSKNDSINKLYVADETPVTPDPKEAVTAVLPEKESKVPAETKVAEQKKVVQKNKKHTKKIRLEDFSRARIPEQQIEEMKKPLAEEKTIDEAGKKEAVIKMNDAGDVKSVKAAPVLKQKS